jgi:hypothetical protein
MNLNHIADAIDALDLGVTTYIDAMPADESTAILVRAPLQGIPVDHNLPGYYKTSIQVIVRAQKHDRGDALAKAVTDALTTHQRKVYPADPARYLPTITLNHMLPETLPIKYPRSDGNGIEWSINFTVAYVME